MKLTFLTFYIYRTHMQGSRDLWVPRVLSDV
jgi:hypothetical protein